MLAVTGGDFCALRSDDRLMSSPKLEVGPELGASGEAAARRSAAWQRAVKRAIDVVGAVALALLLSPLLLAVALAVLIADGRPVLYRWNVLGKGARPFTGYKFRTMVREADELRHALADSNEMVGPVFKMRDDPRVTRLGSFLRRYSLDELPQLWSVLKGDMSLVGPRPVYPFEFAEFQPWQRRKLSVTPGITCLWQVAGRNEIEHVDDWIRLDLAYIDAWSLRLDLVILLRTIPAVVGRRGAW
jgi:lipopolysaccharide/colanic/teichoic acid biosynthesis glycosyltransferase